MTRRLAPHCRAAQRAVQLSLELVPHHEVRRHGGERNDNRYDAGSDEREAGAKGHGSRKHVARAADCVDQAQVFLGLRLAPEIADVDVERVRGVAEVVAPDSLVDERARQHLARVPHEQLEQVGLRRGQLEAAAATAGVHRAEIEAQVGEAQNGARLLGLRAAQQRPQAREELLEVVRLREVVVGTCVEALDAIPDRVAGGEQEDRDAVPLPPQPAGHVEAVEPGHHHVEHDGVGRARVHSRQRRVSVGRQRYLVAVQLQRTLERLAHRTVVVCHQHEHFVSSLPCEVRFA